LDHSCLRHWKKCSGDQIICAKDSLVTWAMINKRLLIRDCESLMPEKCTSDFHRKCAERAFSTVKRYRATRSSPTTESFTAPGREGAVFSCCTKILCCKTRRQTGLPSSIGDYTCSVVHQSTENLKVLDILV
jgi:hypothetical protein